MHQNIEQILKELTLEEKAQLCSGRDFWMTQDIERLDIPKVMMCDGPNGLRKQPGEADHLGINTSIETVCYPTASAVASSFDVEMLEELGHILGQECQAEKVGMLLGPGVNMKRSPLCGRNFEYFSEDPYLTGKLAAAYIRGLQSEGVAACVKHFACNNQETRRMSGNSVVDERTLHEIYLPAFETAVKEGKTRSIMCSYNAVNGSFSAENTTLLTDILRTEWGFDGFVVTDWGAVKDRVTGLLAGLDLEMPGSTEGKTAKIIAAVENGSLPESVLDKAVQNILKFVCDACKNQNENAIIDRQTFDEKALHFAEDSAVLMKNEEKLLPIQKNRKLAVIGAYADKPRYQGAGSSHINSPHVVSFLEAMEGRGWEISYAEGFNGDTGETTEELLQEAAKTAHMADTVLLFVGLPELYETEGADREDLELPIGVNRLVETVCSVNPNTAVVLHCGAPVVMPWYDKVKSVLCMYLGGDRVGEAAANLLTGAVNPSGKLAESWPLRLEDTPSYLNFPGEEGVVNYAEGIYIGYRYYDKRRMQVQVPFGYGQSYTEFEYSDLRFDKTELTETGELTVSCKVKNIGSVSGKEVVQLYVGIPHSRVNRAVRELKGFAKVSLDPGEEKTVSFTLSSRAFAYWEKRICGWFLENGPINIEIGSSSRDLRLHGQVQMNSSMFIPTVFDRTTTIGELLQNPKSAGVLGKMMGAGHSEEDQQAADDAMGAGAKRMREKMMMEMPVGSLVSYGRMNDEQLDHLLAMLNA
jgi:beta-glucosidase